MSTVYENIHPPSNVALKQQLWNKSQIYSATCALVLCLLAPPPHTLLLFAFCLMPVSASLLVAGHLPATPPPSPGARVLAPFVLQLLLSWPAANPCTRACTLYKHACCCTAEAHIRMHHTGTHTHEANGASCFIAPHPFRGRPPPWQAHPIKLTLSSSPGAPFRSALLESAVPVCVRNAYRCLWVHVSTHRVCTLPHGVLLSTLDGLSQARCPVNKSPGRQSSGQEAVDMHARLNSCLLPFSPQDRLS
jgi:hypothetical protein